MTLSKRSALTKWKGALDLPGKFAQRYIIKAHFFIRNCGYWCFFLDLCARSCLIVQMLHSGKFLLSAIILYFFVCNSDEPNHRRTCNDYGSEITVPDANLSSTTTAQESVVLLERGYKMFEGDYTGNLFSAVKIQ